MLTPRPDVTIDPVGNIGYCQRMHVRAMSLVEVMMVVAMIGVSASVGVAGLTSVMRHQHARLEAERFARDFESQRASGIRIGGHGLMRVNPTANGTSVVYAIRRLGTPTETPCQLLTDGAAADTSITRTYDLPVVMTNGDRRIDVVCFSSDGRPRTSDLQGEVPISLGLGGEGLLSIDAHGVVDSPTLDIAMGIAETAMHPADIMAEESAPVVPNAADLPAGFVYEEAPGVSGGGGGGGAGGGGAGGGGGGGAGGGGGGD